jgi:hypothetical protein
MTLVIIFEKAHRKTKSKINRETYEEICFYNFTIFSKEKK